MRSIHSFLAWATCDLFCLSYAYSVRSHMFNTFVYFIRINSSVILPKRIITRLLWAPAGCEKQNPVGLRKPYASATPYGSYGDYFNKTLAGETEPRLIQISNGSYFFGTGNISVAECVVFGTFFRFSLAFHVRAAQIANDINIQRGGMTALECASWTLAFSTLYRHFII